MGTLDRHCSTTAGEAVSEGVRECVSVYMSG